MYYWKFERVRMYLDDIGNAEKWSRMVREAEIHRTVGYLDTRVR